LINKNKKKVVVGGVTGLVVVGQRQPTRAAARLDFYDRLDRYQHDDDQRHVEFLVVFLVFADADGGNASAVGICYRRHDDAPHSSSSQYGDKDAPSFAREQHHHAPEE
jgi:hypothetical protein